MSKQMILNFLNSDFHSFSYRILKQHWTTGSYSYKNISRPDHAIMLLLSGKIDFVTDNEILSAKSGDLIFLPKGSRYEAVFLRESEPIVDYLVNFDTSLNSLSDVNPTLLFENASFQCAELCEQLSKEYRSDNCSLLRTKGLFYQFLDTVVSMKQASVFHSILEKAQTLLKTNLTLSIPEIAHACCISESSLRRLFLEHLGISPVKYRLQTKIEQAKYLLDSTSMSINEIAASLNFYDTAYFCKVFHTNVGMTPSQYMKNKKL